MGELTRMDMVLNIMVSDLATWSDRVNWVLLFVSLMIIAGAVLALISPNE